MIILSQECIFRCNYYFGMFEIHVNEVVFAQAAKYMMIVKTNNETVWNQHI